MDRLIAQDAALQQCFAFSRAQDTLDRGLFLSLFQPDQKVILDLSKHLLHIPVSELTPEEFWAAVVHSLSGFTATHHQLGNHVFECDEALQKVTVTARVTAYHCLEQDGALSSVTARVNQTMDLRLWQGKWVICRVAVERQVPLDNADLYLVAQERAKNGQGRAEVSPASK